MDSMMNMLRRSSRNSKDKSVPAMSATTARSSASAVQSAAAKAEKERLDKSETFFKKYSELVEGEEVIGPEGVERLCSDLDVEPSDVKILVLAWKLNAARMGYFTKGEWQKGMRQIGVDSLEKLKAKLPSFSLEEIRDPSSYEDFFRFGFKFCLTEPGRKTLDLDTCATMLSLVASHKRHTKEFVHYLLDEQKDYKVVNLDQWTSFLRFSNQIDADFSNYDESMAWPLILDNFVEFEREKRKGGGGGS